MAAGKLVIAVLGMMAMIANATIVPEFIVISHPDVNVEDVVTKTTNNIQSKLRGASVRKPKIKQQLKMEDEEEVNEVKVARSRMFTLVSDLSSDAKDALLQEPGIFQVVANSKIELAVMNTDPVGTTVRASLDRQLSEVEELTQEWNLDRVDQVFGRDGVYTAAEETGSNVDLYILDTGVQANHVAFTGRVQDGKDATVSGDAPGNSDCHGHGTHVAGTAAGDIYGIARGALIFPVRVLDCAGSGSLMSLSQGAQWARDNIQKRGSSRKAVVNLSIQAGASDVIDELIRSLYQVGAVVVVAAANFNSDACNYSPAREPVAVTVGSTSTDDTKLSSSNFGPCVDLYAPGDNILSAAPSATSKSANAVKRGTSMASPLVAGIAATLREKYPSYSNAKIAAELVNIATTLGPRVNDPDCSGSLEGQKFAQTISAQDRTVGLQRSSLVAVGSFVQGEIFLWAPDMTLSTKPDSEICISFSARVGAARGPVSSASVRLAVSTNALPEGAVSFVQTSSQCKDTTTRWYVMDSFGDNSKQLSSKIWDFNGAIIGDSQRTPSGELSTSESRKFYVSIKTIPQGLSLELGSGDGASERDRIPLVTAVDSNFKVPLSSLSKLSLSSNANYDIVYSDISYCSGFEHTTPPTGPPSAGGGSPPPTELKVVRANRNKFFSWPAGWSKGEALPNSCFQFQLNFAKTTKLFVALATEALGKTQFNNIPAGSHAHVLIITRNNVQLKRDGTQVDHQSLSPMLPVRNKRALTVAFKVTATPEGEITVQINVGGSWQVLYSFTDSEATFMGTRFSLTTSMARNFTNISTCIA